MSKVTVVLQAAAWSLLGFFGITKLSPHVSEIVTPAITILAGFVGPALVEWGQKANSFLKTHRNEAATACSLAMGVVAYLVANQHMNQQFAGVITAAIVFVTHALVPSSAHPSRLP